jgi:hypothetical protein
VLQCHAGKCPDIVEFIARQSHNRRSMAMRPIRPPPFRRFCPRRSDCRSSGRFRPQGYPCRS